MHIIDFSQPDSNPIQIGLPQLFEPRGSFFFDIIKRWLWNCDKNHSGPHQCRPSSSGRLPTRLIEVDKDNMKTVWLRETVTIAHGKYVALSHPWGPNHPHKHFTTVQSNYEQHKQGILIQTLPATFRDAITTTRELEIRYLWIDSICIIQSEEGNDGDFSDESKRMEDVYSNAYCVLAASRATSQHDGFLKPRASTSRRYVTLPARGKGKSGHAYICEPIDDFNGDVLEGHLNQRGWVLQEHALARRTIFFAETQTYWECGEGVMCETMTIMKKYVSA